jgi:GNAT superfamily N-acetyltransferase
MDLDSDDIQCFEKWTKSVWGNIDDSQKSDLATEREAYILAYVNNELVGGLAFTKYKDPIMEGLALWIDAVLVQDAFQHQGIASALIRKSEEVLIEYGQFVGYVYTDIPILYSKMGWHIIEQEEKGFVLKKEL